jgi:hypothetical protein
MRLTRPSSAAFGRKRKWRIIFNALRLDMDDPVRFLTDNRHALTMPWAGVTDR